MIEKSERLDDQLKIRRYLSLSKFLDVLERQRLFFSRMSAFEDKLEGRLTELDDFFVSGNHELLHNIVHNALPAALGDRSKAPEARERSRKFEEEFKNRTVSTVFGEIRQTAEIPASSIMSKQKNWLDVSCWDKNPSESVAMWKIYGGAESSVCIHTTIGALTGSIVLPPHLTLYIGEVEYIAHREEVYMGEHRLGYFMRKHQAYGYENEVRLIVYDQNAKPLVERDELGTYLPVDVGSLIKEITVSPEADAWFVILITDLVARYGLRVPVSTSALHKLATDNR